MFKKNNGHTFSRIWNCKWLYLMLLPVLLYYIVFKYIPMYGVTIAFKDYNVFKEVLGGP